MSLIFIYFNSSKIFFNRMCVTAQRAMLFGEPILLVGETGCGKTSVCQLLTHQGVLSKACDLVVINCHSHTDASDFIGGLRPVRNIFFICIP